MLGARPDGRAKIISAVISGRAANQKLWQFRDSCGKICAIHPPLAASELRLSSKAKHTDVSQLALQKIAPLIHEIRGERVILDSDLARIYGVSTRRLNEQVKRNIERFPEDFAFQMTSDEWQSLKSQNATLDVPIPDRSQTATSSSVSNRSQFATGSQKHRDPRFLPYAFTEHGAIMGANVLNSKQAVAMSVFVVRAFVTLRETLATHRDLADKLTELERKVGTHDKALVSIIAAIRELTDSPKRKAHAIGFRAKPEAKSGAQLKQLERRARKK